jgi:hypothetical protein
MATDQGKPIARLGDKATCPRCKKGWGPIVTADPHMKIQGIPVARDGDIVDCGCSYGSNRLVGISSASLLGETAGSNGSDNYSETAGGVAGNYRQGAGAGNGAVNETVASNGAVNGGIVTEIKRSSTSQEAAAKPAASASSSSSGSSTLDKVRTGLDVAGMVPIVGTAASVVSAGIDVAVGDYGMAALDAAAMIPGAGTGIKAAKLGVKGAKVVREMTAAEKRAKEIHGALDKISQNHQTTAVTETKEGVTIISKSTSRRLTPAQRSLLKDGEIEAENTKTHLKKNKDGSIVLKNDQEVYEFEHAEVAGINFAKKKGYTPIGTAASRPICEECEKALKNEGVEPLSSLHSNLSKGK